jgi:small-conductance mechanosensitive channel
MNELFTRAASPSLFGKCAAAAVGILLIHAAFRLLEQSLPRRFGRADARYRVREFLVFSGYVTILLFVSVLFEDRLGRLSFAIGVAGAFAIGFSRLYAAGDRVQIGETRGDVIDIGRLQTTLISILQGLFCPRWRRSRRKRNSRIQPPKLKGPEIKKGRPQQFSRLALKLHTVEWWSSCIET